MTYVLTLLLGLALGGWSLWWLQRKEIQYLRDELTTAQDRLYHAWRDGASIPSREQVAPPKATPLVPLPDDLQPLVSAFASPEAQADTDTFIRQKLAQGWGSDRIREALEGS